MNRGVVCFIALACAWFIAFDSTSAHAQAVAGRPTNPQAIAHFQQGNAHYKVREFDEAAKEYKAGELIEAAAIFDYNLGQCYRQLTRYQAAIWHYDRYLRSGVATQADTEAINKWITEMRSEMEQRAKSTPPTEPATMQQQPAAPSQPATLHVAPWYYDGVAWALAGSGLVIGGIGGGLLLDASSLRDDANHASTQVEQNSLNQKADSRTLAGSILAIGGGALLVTGIIKLAIHAGPSPSQRSALAIGVTANGFVVAGTF